MEKKTPEQLEDKKPTSPKPLDAFIQMKKDARWKVFGQAAFITLASIFIFGAIGWALDEWVRGEGHLFLILMLVISYPVTQITLYKKMKHFNSKKDQ